MKELAGWAACRARSRGSRPPARGRRRPGGVGREAVALVLAGMLHVAIAPAAASGQTSGDPFAGRTELAATFAATLPLVGEDDPAAAMGIRTEVEGEVRWRAVLTLTGTGSDGYWEGAGRGEVSVRRRVERRMAPGGMTPMRGS